MKSLVLVLSLLLMALLASLAGHSAHHGPRARPGQALRLPPRVLRSPAVARQHRLVRKVEERKN